MRYTAWVSSTHNPNPTAQLIAKDLQDRDRLVQKEARPPKARKVHSHTLLWRFSGWLTLICVVGAVVGAVVALASWQRNVPPSPVLTFAINTIVGCVAVLAFYWLFAILFLFLRTVHRNAKVAFAPIPTLQTLDAQLRQEFPGCQPSLQDLLAVEARIKSERNEAALVTGGMLVGIHLAGRVASGKPIL